MVNVKSHTRKTKGGKTVRVKAHTRGKPVKKVRGLQSISEQYYDTKFQRRLEDALLEAIIETAHRGPPDGLSAEVWTDGKTAWVEYEASPTMYTKKTGGNARRVYVSRPWEIGVGENTSDWSKSDWGEILMDIAGEEVDSIIDEVLDKVRNTR